MGPELSELLHCNIYRDGGSLEGTWLTSEKNEWTITLAVTGDWNSLAEFDNRHFKLFNCRLNEIKEYDPIQKNGVQYGEMMKKLGKWIATKHIGLEELKKGIADGNRLYDLLLELEKGNF